jgi:hypothetical protein
MLKTLKIALIASVLSCRLIQITCANAIPLATRKLTKDLRNELRFGAGLPFTLIASTPGVIQINGNIEISRSYSRWIPLLKAQYSSYQRLNRIKGRVIATNFQLSLNGIEFHTGLKYRFFINHKKNSFELRPLLTIGKGFGKFTFKDQFIRRSQNYMIYTAGLELISHFKKNYFLSFAGTVSRIVYSPQENSFDIKYNRPTLELNAGFFF